MYSIQKEVNVTSCDIHIEAGALSRGSSAGGLTRDVAWGACCQVRRALLLVSPG